MDTHRKAGASVTDAPAFLWAPQNPHEVHVKYKIGCNFFLQSDSVSYIMLKS